MPKNPPPSKTAPLAWQTHGGVVLSLLAWLVFASELVGTSTWFFRVLAVVGLVTLVAYVVGVLLHLRVLVLAPLISAVLWLTVAVDDLTEHAISGRAGTSVVVVVAESLAAAALAWMLVGASALQHERGRLP